MASGQLFTEQDMGISVTESVVVSENLKPEFSEKSMGRRTGSWNYSSPEEGAQLCGASGIRSIVCVSVAPHTMFTDRGWQPR